MTYTPEVPSAAQDGKSVLIVEDEALIGLDMARTLRGSGYRVIGPFSNENQALDAMAETHPDAALLDVHLGKGRDSLELAAVLDRRRVPFAFLTGYALSETTICEKFPHAPRLAKPCRASDLQRQVDRFFSAAA